MPEIQKTRNFVFFLDEGFTMQAFSSAVEVLRLVRQLKPGAGFSYSVVALNDAPVAASNGLQLIPDAKIDAVPSHAVIVAVSGAHANRTSAPSFVARIREWSRHGHAVWGVSSGVVRLAQAGMLDDRRVAAHWEDVRYLRQAHEQVLVSAALFFSDGQVATCAGGGAATDMMLWVIARDLGVQVADDIAARLVIDAVRDGRTSQRRVSDMRFETANGAVYAALGVMRANLFTPLTIAEVAETQGISQRHLERLFVQEFNRTPSNVYTELRLEDARLDVLSGRRSLTDIAMDYGYSPATFARNYQKIFGLSPSDDRRGSGRGMS
ncbi:HTH-type transcriptional regulator CdhR [Falsiruegeria litorea R37]|uniref:HTH-type transcriptional regulator CdhR n=1 Tax=Falsiruegeria litorea R37 TaxID=1200284 RepID=A0A1Y5SVD0_9RHOB|nr:helix-turn-helix domain-containing protein [Falsiruegeria litorea]SLN49434.1 HTH-type transcriptional regulator CdhR [Falsiruegeria litorea R37]